MTGSEKSAIKAEVIAFKKRRILEEAMALFYEAGYRETSLDNLAERLNVTKPFIYSYFSGKAEILYEIVRPAVEMTLQAAVEVSQSDAPPATKLRELIKRFTIVVCENRASIALYQRNQKSLSKKHQQSIASNRRSFDEILEATLKAGNRSGELKVRNAKIAGLAFSGMVNWVHTWYKPDGPITPSQLGDQLADLALAAVAPGSAPDAP